MIYEIVKGLSKLTTNEEQVLPDIFMLDFTIVKAYMVIVSDKSGWVLIDTGLENSYDFIMESSEKHFGKGSKPKAIILTHGHFDHAGSVVKLAENWDVKVYAHASELPYLTGQKNYPKPDPSVDEGLVAKMSPAFPNEGINLGSRISAFNLQGNIPELPGWEWIHTPGHSEGHISLYRNSDKVLIVGDAFTTTKQESLLSVLSGKEEVKGPPAYLTPDWFAAKQSIETLKNLHPSIALPSHGNVMRGEELEKHLSYLIENFEEVTVPREGK